MKCGGLVICIYRQVELLTRIPWLANLQLETAIGSRSAILLNMLPNVICSLLIIVDQIGNHCLLSTALKKYHSTRRILVLQPCLLCQCKTGRPERRSKGVETIQQRLVSL